jgi:hypothetical protein
MDRITKLIDERIELKREAERIKERLAAIDEDLKEDAEHGEILLGSSGYGYRYTTQESRVFNDSAVRYLEGLGLLRYLAKVSTTALEALKKNKKLSQHDIDILNLRSTIKTTQVLREYIPDEAKIL